MRISISLVALTVLVGLTGCQKSSESGGPPAKGQLIGSWEAFGYVDESNQEQVFPAGTLKVKFQMKFTETKFSEIGQNEDGSTYEYTTDYKYNGTEITSEKTNGMTLPTYTVLSLTERTLTVAQKDNPESFSLVYRRIPENELVKNTYSSGSQPSFPTKGVTTLTESTLAKQSLKVSYNAIGKNNVLKPGKFEGQTEYLSSIHDGKGLLCQQVGSGLMISYVEGIPEDGNYSFGDGKTSSFSFTLPSIAFDLSKPTEKLQAKSEGQKKNISVIWILELPAGKNSSSQLASGCSYSIGREDKALRVKVNCSRGMNTTASKEVASRFSLDADCQLQ